MNTSMLQRSLRIVSVALVAGALSSAQAQPGSEYVCSNATFQGTYGLSGSGFDISAAPVLGAEAGIAVFTADGEGRVTAFRKIVDRPDGKVEEQDFSLLPFTYSVNPDCTGTTRVIVPTPLGNEVVETAIILVNGGREGWTVNLRTHGSDAATVNSIALASFKRIDDFDEQLAWRMDQVSGDLADIRGLLGDIALRLGIGPRK